MQGFVSGMHNMKINYGPTPVGMQHKDGPVSSGK